MERIGRMMPVIRKTHSSNSGLGNRLLHCFLLLLFLFFSFTLLRSCVKRCSRLDDFSGGRYAETFKTGNSVLKKELLSLRGPIIEQDLRSSGMLERFHELHWKYAAVLLNSSDSSRSVSQEGSAAFFDRLYPEWLEAFHSLLGEVRRPLKGVEGYAGDFSDFQMMLQLGINGFREEKCSPELVLRTLNVMFDYAYVMMFSDSPDVSYLESAVHSLESLLRTRPLSGRDRRFLAEMVKRNLSRPFPRRNLICHSLLRSLRDYEKVRLNGLRLFMGEQKPGTSLKESLSVGRRSSFFTALKVWIRDFFYDVDRDQIQAIRMYKTFLKETAFPSDQEIDSFLANPPTRPMARREYDLFRDELRRHSEVQNKLRNLLSVLESSAAPLR